MWVRIDSQEVGLEAATLERVRNSSLVEWTCADNVTGLNTPPKPRMPYFVWRGSRASILLRSSCGSSCGAWSSANVGMSSERGVRNPSTESPRVPGEGYSSQGESGPKARPKGVVDG